MAATRGGIEVKDMAPGGPLPAVMPKGSYELKKQVDLFGKNAFYLAISLMDSGHPQEAKRLLDEVISAPLGRYDVAEERRSKALAGPLLTEVAAKLK